MKRPEIDSRLEKFPFLGRLSSEGERSVRGQAASLRFPAGTVLLSEGQLCQALLLVTEGAIRVFKAAPSGREITLYTVKPGKSCLLGVSCLLTDSHYPAQAVTGSETEALSVPAPVFRTLFASEPPVQQYVNGLFSRRLSGVMTLVEEVAIRRMDERLASFLISSSDRGGGIYGPVAMSHEETADHLGTAREVVSRLLSQFESAGLIAVERRMVVHRVRPRREAARNRPGQGLLRMPLDPSTGRRFGQVHQGDLERHLPFGSNALRPPPPNFAQRESRQNLPAVAL